jgi:uncharacterized protein
MLDQPMTWALLVGLGTFTGAVAGVLGIGGGLLMVPALSVLNLPLVQATATSLVGVFLSATSGSVENWRKGQLNLKAVAGLAAFGLLTAQLGAWAGDRIPESWLAFSFAALMLLTIYLMNLKQQLKQQAAELEAGTIAAYTLVPMAQIGLLAGLLSGLFGVGGGAVMVPLQVLRLGEPIKSAVRTSLGAIVPIAASGLAQHTWNHNVLWIPGICLGLGGILGAQLGTRLLPRLSDQLVNQLFRLLLLLLMSYMIWKGIRAWK